jgi:hypothetical protein
VSLFETSAPRIDYRTPSGEESLLSGIQPSLRSDRDDLLGEREASEALKEIKSGGRLYSFEDVFGERL